MQQPTCHGYHPEAVEHAAAETKAAGISAGLLTIGREIGNFIVVSVETGDRARVWRA